MKLVSYEQDLFLLDPTKHHEFEHVAQSRSYRMVVEKRLPTQEYVHPMGHQLDHGSIFWLKRRVIPIKPRMYNGIKAKKKPMIQNQKARTPHFSFSVKP